MNARLPISVWISGVAAFLIAIAVGLFMDRSQENKKEATGVEPTALLEESKGILEEPAKPLAALKKKGNKRPKELANELSSPYVNKADAARKRREEEAIFGNPEIREEPEEHRPLARVNPFLRLPTEINLPTWTSEANEPTDKNLLGTKVCKFYRAPSDGIEIQISHAAANLDGRYEMQVKRDPGVVGKLEWVINLVPIPSANGENDPGFVAATDVPYQPIAHLTVEKSQLKFRWGPNKHEITEQLRNCTLILKDNGYKHEMNLRRLLRMPALLVDMEKVPVAMLPIEMAALPDTNKFFLEIVSLEGFPNSWQLKRESKRGNSGEEVILSNNSKPKIELRFRLLIKKGTPTVSIKAYYYSYDDRKEQLSKKTVGNRIKQLTKTVASNIAKGKGANFSAGKIKSRIRSISKTRASSQQQQDEKGAVLRQLNSQLSSRISTMKKLNRSVPKTQASLKHLKKVASLAGEIHQKAKVKLRVGVAAEEGDFDLVVIE